MFSITSHGLVSSTVEKSLGPGLSNSLGELTLGDGVLNLSVLRLRIHLSAVVHAIISELEAVLVNYATVFLKNFEQSLLTFGSSIRELTESQEIFTVHTVVGSNVGSESADIKTLHVGGD